MEENCENLICISMPLALSVKSASTSKNDPVSFSICDAFNFPSLLTCFSAFLTIRKFGKLSKLKTNKIDKFSLNSLRSLERQILILLSPSPEQFPQCYHLGGKCCSVSGSERRQRRRQRQRTHSHDIYFRYQIVDTTFFYVKAYFIEAQSRCANESSWGASLHE